MTAFYRDINSIDPNNRPSVTDVQAVVQAVRNLISTRRGELLFRPNFGINLEDYLFELMDEAAGLQLLTEVIDAVRVYEPRVEIEVSRSEVIARPETNTFDVQLFFNIIGFEEGGVFNITESIGA